MSIAGDPQTQTGGASNVPANDVNRQPGAAVPSGDAGAAMSPAGDGDGAGTPDLSALSGLNLQDPEVVQFIRENSDGFFYTRDDMRKSQSTLAQRAEQQRQAARQAQEALNAQQSRAQYLESQLREQLGEEEAENLLARFDRDNAQSQQALQQEREQLAQEWVSGEQRSFQDFLMESAFDGERQLFNPQDPEVQSAYTNYLQAVRAAALIQDDDSLEVANQWKRYARSTVIKKMRAALQANQQTTQAAEPEQPPNQQQRPSRGRQVTAPGGAGGGVPSFGDLYKQNIEGGMNPEEAFDQANLAIMTAGSAS